MDRRARFDQFLLRNIEAKIASSQSMAWD